MNEPQLWGVELVPAQFDSGDERPLIHPEGERTYVAICGQTMDILDPYLIEGTLTSNDEGQFVSVKIGGRLGFSLDAGHWEAVRSNYSFVCVYDPDSAFSAGVDPCDPHFSLDIDL
jgi:hypothetical protein